MTVAEQKKKENICEYILYIWQMEDLMRSVELDAEALFSTFGFDDSDQSHAEKEWFRTLARQMKSEKLEKVGHLSEVNTILTELLLLHNTLLNLIKEKNYVSAHDKSRDYLKTLMDKAPQNQNPIEHVLIALYGLLILRLQKREVHADTLKAMSSFSDLMALLSVKYREMKNGELNSSQN